MTALVSKLRSYAISTLCMAILLPIAAAQVAINVPYINAEGVTQTCASATILDGTETTADSPGITLFELKFGKMKLDNFSSAKVLNTFVIFPCTF